MDIVDLIRTVDIVAICVSIGFVASLTMAHWDKLPSYVYGLVTSYGLFAIGSIVEVELAIHANEPVSWRTVIITLGAVVGVATAVGAWLHHDDGA